MGLWGVLWEIARAVVPHAAPHVARAVADRAKERRAAALEAVAEKNPQPGTQDLAAALNYLEQRLSVAEEKTAAAEQDLCLAQARMASQWATARKWAIGLLIWNVLVTAAVIVLAIFLGRR